ncbi:hypothetical protein [Trinickia dinghuensis]|uniref:Uncharacterized protein n=1 Tax=Trinickia dinghuensis TaxID=2291023 RepID=A0A3D8K6C1_9BURK|nr:hypothetical protein [Trinickia dinghuensis]RDV00427.1 hypothetical protein DWV00_01135 [Trinickia dinghuensis]
MSIFSKIKHGLEDVGHDIAHAAKDVGHGLETAGKDIAKVGEGVVKGVEEVGKTLVSDTAQVAQHTLDAFDDVVHGQIKNALNQTKEAVQDLAKTAYDAGSATEQATVDSLAHMHLSKKMDKAMGKAEQGMKKIGQGIKTGVGMVATQLGKDAGTVGKDLAKTGNDLVHGRWQQALDDTVKTAQDGFNAAYDTSTALGHATVDSLANMHLSKGMDKAMGKVEKGYDALGNNVKSSVDQVGAEVVDGTEGAIKDTVQAGKDAVHGHWGAMASDLGNVGMDTLEVASDLSPEGAMAAVGTQMLENAHIGSQQLDETIGGAIHGNVAQTVKGVVKGVSEMEVGNEVQDKLGSLAAKVTPEGGSGSASSYAGVAAAGALGIAGSGGFSVGSKRSHASLEGEAGRTGGPSRMKISERFSTMTGRSGGKGRTVQHEQAAAGKTEDEKEKESKKADNAQNAANNTASQGGGDNGQLDQDMLDLFMLQAGMNRPDGSKKRRALLTGDA